MLIEQAFIPLPQSCRLLLFPLHNGFGPNIGPIIMQAFLTNFYMQLISSSSNPQFCFETGLEKPLSYLQLIFLSYDSCARLIVSRHSRLCKMRNPLAIQACNHR